MKSYGLDLSFWVAAGVLAIIRVATVLPNAPGNVGLLNVACVVALRLFDVETNDAKTFSFILLGAQAFPLLARRRHCHRAHRLEHRRTPRPRQTGRSLKSPQCPTL